MGTVHVVNMIPAAMSGETNQDSEPNIAVNPQQPTDIVATAFTPAPMGGSFAPIYVSTDGGNIWALRSVVPGNGSFGTGDITVGFATTGGMLYAGILNGTTGRMQILRTSGFSSTTPMSVLVDRTSEDQPWVVAGSVVVGGVSRDRVYVGNEDGNQPLGRTATVDVSQDAATAPAPAGFTPIQLEHRSTVVIAGLGRGKDGPPIRTAVHPDGTVYSAFHRWASGTFPNLNIDIVVTRDNNWGASVPPFSALVDSGDHVVGQRIATNRFIRFNALMGQERLGGDLSIAVDPADSGILWVAWCDRVGGMAGTDWTLHVSHSIDRGQTWSADVRTITNAKNPSLAVNSNRLLGLAYQQFTGAQWVTTLELTANSWAAAAETHVLHQAPSNTPFRVFLPYIGDYIRLIAVGADFYGVFSGNNTPDLANFPSGVTYQRGANFTTHILLNTDGTTPVAVSIDPFFFHWSNTLIPISRGPISRGPIVPGPIARGPILPGPIVRQPIVPGPIIREPINPIGVPQAPPATPTPAPDAPATPKRGGRRTPRSPKPPTDIDL
ncbi:MAG: BNR/Asp-box repeat protein [Chthonomonadaceae bacterium]|nr:BNR/Asp-box repeat protein [Chthonomonadaceae bacterium]